MPTNKLLESTEFIEAQPLLLECAVSSDLDKFVEESLRIAKRCPRLLAEIGRDLDVHGLKKKHVRQVDRHFIETRTEILKGIDVQPSMELEACSSELEQGRPRMPALAPERARASYHSRLAPNC